MDAFVDLKSESVAQTQSEKYDDPAHLKTCRRVVAPTCRPIAKVVRSSDRKPLSASRTLVYWSANAQHSGCSRYSF